MTSRRALKRIKCKRAIFCSLIAPQTQTYDTLVVLGLKCFSRTLVIAFKSPNTVFIFSLRFSISSCSTSTVFFILKLLNFKENFLVDSYRLD